MPAKYFIAVLMALPLAAADPEGFALWKPAELQRHERELSKTLRPDHSSRETLADYKNHRFRLLYRAAEGYPEQHDNEVDVVIVQSGEGVLQVGGKLVRPEVNPEANNGVGEWKGAGLEGGERRNVAAGDIVHIPAGVPHTFLIPKGKHLTYVLLKLPAR